MKARYLFLTATLLVAVGSCCIEKTELISSRVGEEIVFYATSAEPETKTELQPDSQIWWLPGDEIKVFYGASAGDKFTADISEKAAKATFRGSISAFTGITEAGEYNYFWAVYPYDAAVSCDGSSVVATLCNVQTAQTGTFSSNTNITLAKAPGLALSFYNVCSFFRFSITHEGVKTVTFSGNNGEDVAGTFSVTMGNDGRPTTPVVSEGQKSITLTAPGDGTFEVGKNYYFVILPQTFENGFTLTFRTESTVGSRSVNVSAPFNRNIINWGDNFDRDVNYVPASVIFEDDNFKAYCVLHFDEDGDGEISIEEAEAATEIFVYTNNISSLNGLEYFTNLERLICRPDYNMYSEDISKREKKYYYNGAEVIGQITSLDISNNKHLTYLECWGNQLSSLDVSECGELRTLACSSNQLTQLDISNNTLLTSIGCGYNELSTLDVSNNILLTSINCAANLLSNIDVSKNTELTSLYCSGNRFVSLDVSSNSSLVSFNCGYNNLTSLIVSSNTELKYLYISNNKINEINISNNDKLVSFHCDKNELTNLDLSNNSLLEYFNCDNNKLTHLDLSNQTRLYDFYCRNNRLTELDLSNQTRLDRLWCGNNELTSLRFSENISADDIDCKNNMLTGLDVSNKSISKLDLSGNTLLTTVHCFDCHLTSLDVSGCSSLSYLDCTNNNLRSLNTTSNPLLVHLDCPGNPSLTELDVSYNSNLNHLNCNINSNLTTLWLMTGQTVDQLYYNSSITSIHYKGANQNIVFADENVKAVCVDHWDKNGDGELSHVEAAAVTSFEDFFTNHTEIILFDEVDYFFNVKSIADSAFYGCDHLTSFVIPDQVTSIGSGAFLGCQSLSYIKFGAGVSSVGNNILNPEYIRTLVVSENNKTFDSRNNCNSLVWTMTNTLLYGGRNSTIPEGIVSIGDRAFTGSGLINFTLPSTLKHIGEFAFGGYNEYKHITCLATTPPRLDLIPHFHNWHPFVSSIVLSFETIIYVPDECYDAYQSTWGTYQDITIERIGD